MATRMFGFYSPSVCLMVALALIFCGESQGSGPLAETRVTQLAVSDDSVPPSKFTFSIGDDSYIVHANGKGRRERSGEGSQEFVLPVDGGAIEKVQYLKVDKAIVLIYELNDAESGWGHLVSLESKTLRRKWLTRVSGFNLGQGLLEDSYLYLTAIGFVSKLDLRSGRYVWKHERLYRPGFTNSEGKYEVGYFNNFLTPQLDGNEVLFPEEEPRPHDDPRYRATPRLPVTLRADKNTGKLLTELPLKKGPN